MIYQRTKDNIHRHFKELHSIQKSTEDTCFIQLNVHYFSHRFNRVEVYCRPHDFNEKSDILTRLKKTIEIDQGVKIRSIHATSKRIELIDDEDLYVAILFFYDTFTEPCNRQLGMDIWINHLVETSV